MNAQFPNLTHNCRHNFWCKYLASCRGLHEMCLACHFDVRHQHLKALDTDSSRLIETSKFVSRAFLGFKKIYILHRFFFALLMTTDVTAVSVVVVIFSMRNA